MSVTHPVPSTTFLLAGPGTFHPFPPLPAASAPLNHPVGGKEPQKAALTAPALPFLCSLLLSSCRSGLWTSTGTTLLPR